MIPDSVNIFTSAVSQLLGDDLQVVILAGSFARGEEKPTSDIDLFLLVENLDIQTMKEIGEIVKRISTDHELNPAVVKLSEFIKYPDWFDLLKLRHEGIALFGKPPINLNSKEDELTAAKRIAKEVLMSARHYLAVSEPIEKFTGGKLFIYILKPLAFALRLSHYANTGSYILKTSDLAREYPILNLDPVSDFKQIIEESSLICEDILNS